MVGGWVVGGWWLVFSGATLEHPVHYRSRRASLPLERRQSKDLFTRMANVAELSCCNFAVLKRTKPRKNLASTLPTDRKPR